MKDEMERLSDSEKEPESNDGFIERLRGLVAMAGSATSFAKRAGLSQSGFQRYLSGSEPSRKALITMAETAGVSVEWLATGLGQRDPLRHHAQQDGGYLQDADDFVYIEEMTTAEESIVSIRHAVRRDWLKSRGLEPASLRFLETREGAMAPTIQPGDLLLCETYTHRPEGQIKTGLAPGKLPPQDGIYIVRFILDNDTTSAIRRLRLDMAGGLISIMEAEDHHMHLSEAKQLERIQIVARVVASWRSL
ncbi:hypothetical protein QWY79_03450 [Halomonas sabkhae]|uniref:LexA family transcriptional regulator n=1 Tax=Halomonas sabkhae TaxID=626223 RepID=UPI0025B5C7EF|nr:hypothetical protein [Halomonas sabkhae]MDN3524318.1 hypothetical protein [Halomonas sabkhae]